MIRAGMHVPGGRGDRRGKVGPSGPLGVQSPTLRGSGIVLGESVSDGHELAPLQLLAV